MSQAKAKTYLWERAPKLNWINKQTETYHRNWKRGYDGGKREYREK